VSEVDDQLKWFVVEWLESQKDMVDQQITVHVQNSATSSSTVLQLCLTPMTQTTKKTIFASHNKTTMTLEVLPSVNV